ncbi:SOS response-associated peptidase family protein [Brumicola blandensis]|jgi:putative SOS response-associated peptidase YedK|uniref:Abasic site processing protein n=1 Tax=Brumicola blandensis TaxID=3075611 RepID=A0AAW8QZN0_9ALTE|nr:SOS response-associated peptidase family protein [Alteromonas sp. W409]MDT0582477.1 SOS response-associated peptidase family protein [Alteromonas sp. W409]
MCGYVEINGERAAPVMQQPEFSEYLPFVPAEETRVFYPAFGQNPNRTIDMVLRDKDAAGQLKKVSATWWYDCFDTSEGLMVGNRTTFNARNLQSPFWKHSLAHQRGVVFATGIGESKLVGKTKHQYYMQSDEVFALGALYRRFDKNRYSCAIITRDAHPKMTPFHDKAFPLFLPMSPKFLDIWLDPTIQSHPKIDFLLNNPSLFPTLHVQRVKTYKDKVAMKSSPPVTLISDLIDNE